MKSLQRLSMIVIISICIFAIMPQNISRAKDPHAVNAANTANTSSVSDKVGAIDKKINTNFSVDNLQGTIGKLLGFLRIASGMISVVVIAFTGFNYIIAQNADMKKEVKDKMLPIIIGLVLVFSATSISKFILGAVGG